MQLNPYKRIPYAYVALVKLNSSVLNCYINNRFGLTKQFANETTFIKLHFCRLGLRVQFQKIIQIASRFPSIQQYQQWRMSPETVKWSMKSRSLIIIFVHSLTALYFSGIFKLTSKKDRYNTDRNTNDVVYKCFQNNSRRRFTLIYIV